MASLTILWLRKTFLIVSDIWTLIGLTISLHILKPHIGMIDTCKSSDVLVEDLKCIAIQFITTYHNDLGGGRRVDRYIPVFDLLSLIEQSV